MPGLLVLGAANLGSTVAARFARDGWSCALVARSEQTLEKVRANGHHAIQADARDVDQVDAAFAEATRELGSLDAVVNAVSPKMRPGGGAFGGGPLTEAVAEDLEHYALGVARAVFAFFKAASTHLGAGGSAVQITGGSSRRAIAGKGPWAAGAFATRAMAQSAALELRDRSVHAALLVVDATISDRGDDAASEESVAEAVRYLVAQQPDAWTHELVLTPRSDTYVP